MNSQTLRKYDISLAIFFLGLTIIFIVTATINRDFLEWAFARHHNQLSWYIRPIFLIPFCYFAFKKSLSGIMGTILALATSMFWFPEPDQVSQQVKEFLQYEVDYLTGQWEAKKVLITLLVPLSFIVLGLAFWKRNLWFGLSVIVLMAIGKLIWSIASAGESGKSIIVPAIVGLLLCISFLFWGIRKLDKSKRTKDT